MKARWLIEVFFSKIKQIMCIKSFAGTSHYAVEIQIFIMLILVWLQHIAKYKWALVNLVTSLWLNTFTKIDLFKWLNEPFSLPSDHNFLVTEG